MKQNSQNQVSPTPAKAGLPASPQLFERTGPAIGARGFTLLGDWLMRLAVFFQTLGRAAPSPHSTSTSTSTSSAAQPAGEGSTSQDSQDSQDSKDSRANRINQAEKHTAKLALLGQLAAGVAHEIGQPLLVVRTVSYVLARSLSKGQLPDMEKFTQLTERLESGGEKIAAIVRSLKTLARDGTQDPMERTDFESCVADALELCAAQLRYHDVQLIYQKPKKPLFVSCRRGQISQIILNLLSNGLDATRPLADKWIRLEFSEADATFHRLCVSDSGCGIPEATAKMLMTPFFTTKPSPEGIGLGLSISSKLASDHGGRLYYEAASPNTTFVLELPALAALELPAEGLMENIATAHGGPDVVVN